MVEDIDEYVLQWEGHSSHVTERFSGLLARQSLVDVTLICEGQRLRVHKLVLASCSLYFEEMLEQDLGQEPTILLNDLNFEVLKAMVEFMYCGETSISKQHLEPLLQAAIVFKVKELACIAKNMVGSLTAVGDQGRKCVEFSSEDTENLTEENDYSLFSDDACMQPPRWSEIETDEWSRNVLSENVDKTVESNCSFETSATNNNTVVEYLERNHIEECDTIAENSNYPKAELSLQETACTSITEAHINIPNAIDQSFKLNILKIGSTKNSLEDNSNTFEGDKSELQPVLYGQCDFLNTETNFEEYTETFLPLPQSCLEDKHDSIIQLASDFDEVTRTMNKSLRVYTHKRRKSIEGVEKQFIKTSGLPELPSNECIDLIEEPSRNETELESEYILNVSPKNVPTVIDFDSSDTSEDSIFSCVHFNGNTSAVSCTNKRVRQMKEIFTNEQSDTINFRSNSMQSAPTLRRSMRLSQHENEDLFSQNSEKIKESKKTSIMMSKRKNKESGCCEADENKAGSANYIRKSSDPRRSLRSNGGKPIGSRGGNKARLSLSKNASRREENVVPNTKLKSNKVGIMKPQFCQSFSPKFNTIATVSRALWGDMSDCLENNENSADISDYSPSKEIPFAVGLLPLRAALERMQATPDYQPRKTRSSVTPFKQELNSVKRKNCTSGIDSNNGNPKRQTTHSQNDNLNASTVCHVRIMASHSQSIVRPRRKSLHEQVVAPISSTNIVNRQ